MAAVMAISRKAVGSASASYAAEQYLSSFGVSGRGDDRSVLDGELPQPRAGRRGILCLSQVPKAETQGRLRTLRRVPSSTRRTVRHMWSNPAHEHENDWSRMRRLHQRRMHHELFERAHHYEGAAMNIRRAINRTRNRAADLWLKLRMFRVYRFAFREWVEDVWRHEPGGRMCCDGRECGCYGSCWGDWWEHLLSEKRP